MHRFKNLVLVIAAMSCVATLASTSTPSHAVTIQPAEAQSEDTFIYAWTGGGNLSDDNFNSGGFATLLGSSYATGYDASVSHDAASLLKFDLSPITGGPSSVQSATLNLFTVANPFGASPSPGTPVALEVFALASAFNEGTVSWVTRPSLYDSPGGDTDPDLFGTATATAVGQWVSFDVTSLVQSWVGGSITNSW
jgi:hypothetical protein